MTDLGILESFFLQIFKISIPIIQNLHIENIQKYQIRQNFKNFVKPLDFHFFLNCGTIITEKE